VGGVSSVIAGGKFKQGVLGSLKSQAVGTALQAMGGAYRSRQTGGKQRNGAETETQRSVTRSHPDGQYARQKFTLTVEAQEDFQKISSDLYARFEREPASSVRDAAFLVGDALRVWTEKYGAEAGANIVKVRGGYGVTDLMMGTPWGVSAVSNPDALADVHTHPIGAKDGISGWAVVSKGRYSDSQTGDIAIFNFNRVNGYVFRGGDGAVWEYDFSGFNAARIAAERHGTSISSNDYIRKIR
jgi:hypothetical protein